MWNKNQANPYKVGKRLGDRQKWRPISHPFSSVCKTRHSRGYHSMEQTMYCNRQKERALFDIGRSGKTARQPQGREWAVTLGISMARAIKWKHD